MNERYATIPDAINRIQAKVTRRRWLNEDQSEASAWRRRVRSTPVIPMIQLTLKEADSLLALLRRVRCEPRANGAGATPTDQV